MKDMQPYQKVYNLVKKIPKGKVATYGQIGQLLNLDPRIVGWALNRLAKYRNMSLRGDLKSRRSNLITSHDRRLFRRYAPRNDNIPWQRVINSKGGISTNKLLNIPLGLQRKLLESEGVRFDKNEKVYLKKYLWSYPKLHSLYS